MAGQYRTIDAKKLRGDQLGVGGATPASRQSAITAPTGGATQDAEARTAINAIITALETFGLVTPN